MAFLKRMIRPIVIIAVGLSAVNARGDQLERLLENSKEITCTLSMDSEAKRLKLDSEYSRLSRLATRVTHEAWSVRRAMDAELAKLRSESPELERALKSLAELDAQIAAPREEEDDAMIASLNRRELLAKEQHRIDSALSLVASRVCNGRLKGKGASSRTVWGPTSIPDAELAKSAVLRFPGAGCAATLPGPSGSARRISVQFLMRNGSIEYQVVPSIGEKKDFIHARRATDGTSNIPDDVQECAEDRLLSHSGRAGSTGWVSEPLAEAQTGNNVAMVRAGAQEVTASSSEEASADVNAAK
jgi:hypothetical protein